MVKLITLFGVLMMAHVAYSMIQFQAYVKAAQDPSLSVPADIVGECIVALLIISWGGTQIAGNFKSILASSDLSSKSYEYLTTREDFTMYNHRGRTIALFKKSMQSRSQERR